MNLDTSENYAAPDTRYFKTQEEFNKAVGKDFIKHANQTTQKKQKFLVCLSHGQSPAGPYKNISDYYHKIKNPKNIYYTFLNSPLKSQEGLQGIFDAEAFLNSLLEKGLISKEQILGYQINEEQMEESTSLINHRMNLSRESHELTILQVIFLSHFLCMDLRDQ